MLPAALEHVEEADEVGIDVGVRVLERVAHAGLRREMDHPLRPVSANSSRRPRVGEVDLREAEAGAAPSRGEPRLLQREVVVVVEVVDADDRQPSASSRRDVDSR